MKIKEFLKDNPIEAVKENKIEAAKEAGYQVDVWIDDNPEYIAEQVLILSEQKR